MEVLSVQPIRERVAESLRKAIFDGQLQPGQELKQTDLAQQLGVSRIPVREALLMLERDGLIVVHGNRRATVTWITEESIRDHYDIRSLLEGEAAARAARRPESPEDIRQAQQHLEEVATRARTAEYVRANRLFHTAIWEAAGSPQLTMLLDNLWKGLPPHLPELLPDQMVHSIVEHRKIVEAIETGGTEVARSAMAEHVLRSLSDFLAYRRQVAEGNGIVDAAG
jgi:DNA-binding GntR family transcriptional regulator